MKSLLPLLSIVALTTSVLASVCPTCKNEDCKESEIPNKECGPYHPFAIGLVRIARSTISYKCLHIEFDSGNAWEELQQCILTTSDICVSLRESLNVTACTIHPPRPSVKVPSKNEIDVSLPPEIAPQIGGSKVYRASIFFVLLLICSWGL